MSSKRKFPLKRIEAGRYRCGKFTVEKEPDENRVYGCPSRRFVLHDDYDESLNTCGFQTKGEAVAWLEENGEDFND